jgi:hypothetical protein
MVGGWSHQQAILDLISVARKDKPEYYVIMSGQDYPIRDRSDLLELLGKQKVYYYYARISSYKARRTY